MSAPPRAATRVLRFDRVERAVHWANATLFFVLIATGTLLKMGGGVTLLGDRATLKHVHVYAGFLLPLPLLVALVLPAGKKLRRDLGRLNRWTDDDRRWWSRATRAGAKLGKFNPGQKLNAVFVGAVIVVMLMTGSIMHWPDSFSNSWRTGSTFVHDSTWLVVCIVIAGHIVFALRDFDSLRSMVVGWVPVSWAKRERPGWYEQVLAAQPGASADAIGDVDAGREERIDEPRTRAREVPVVHVEDVGVEGLGGREL